jgi:hypothetical protein
MTHPFINASKTILHAQRDVIKDVVFINRAIAHRALDMQSVAVKKGSALLGRNRSRYTEQVRHTLVNGARQFDLTARRVVDGTSDRAIDTVEQVATMIERQLFPRLERSFDGRVVANLDRFGAPAAEVVAQLAERASDAATKVLAYAEPNGTTKAVRRVAAKTAPARRRAGRAVRKVKPRA